MQPEREHQTEVRAGIQAEAQGLEERGGFEEDEFHLMPWHFSPADMSAGKDCMLIATMLGDEMQTISLHVGTLPDAWMIGS